MKGQQKRPRQASGRRDPVKKVRTPGELEKFLRLAFYHFKQT